MQTELRRLAAASFFSYPDVLESIQSIPHLPVNARKAIITCCRSQSVPRKGTKVRKRLWTEMQKRYDTVRFPGSTLKTTRTLLDITFSLQDLIESPFLAGYLSMLLRNIGYRDISSVKETFDNTLSKEISAAIEAYRPRVLRWDHILNRSKRIRHGYPISQEYGLAPEVHDSIFKRFSESRSALSKAIFFPDIGIKTVGHQARSVLERRFRDIEYVPTYTLLDCEMLYHRTGSMVGGVTEMRYAWKYNDLKPRVYYARGPDVYYASRYIQQVFNIILEHFPVVSIFGRRATSSLRIPPDSRFFIYDYSSFTSTLEEIKNFLLTLADFYRGTQITVVDTFSGPILLDLGDMIDQYNEVCSYYPEFDPTHISWGSVDLEDGLTEFLNHTCGMLGVPGNISSSTLLHGLHLMLVIESEECKCVGDDAAAVDTSGDIAKTDQLLKNIGRLEASKVESWNEETPEEIEQRSFEPWWNYVKRPITRVGNRVVVLDQIVWPPIAVILDLADGFHSTSGPMTRSDQSYRAFTMLHAFLVSLSRNPNEPEEFDKEVIQRFYKSAKEEINRKFGSHHISKILPADPWTARDIDEWLFEISDKVLPLRAVYEGGEFEVIKSEEIILPGGSRALSLARKLGHAVVDKIVEHRVVGSNFERFRSVLLRDSRKKFLSRVVIHDSIPSWLFDMICSDYVNSCYLQDQDDDDFEIDSLLFEQDVAE